MKLSRLLLVNISALCTLVFSSCSEEKVEEVDFATFVTAFLEVKEKHYEDYSPLQVLPRKVKMQFSEYPLGYHYEPTMDSKLDPNSGTFSVNAKYEMEGSDPYLAGYKREIKSAVLNNKELEKDDDRAKTIAIYQTPSTIGFGKVFTVVREESDIFVYESANAHEYYSSSNEDVYEEEDKYYIDVGQIKRELHKVYIVPRYALNKATYKTEYAKEDDMPMVSITYSDNPLVESHYYIGKHTFKMIHVYEDGCTISWQANENLAIKSFRKSEGSYYYEKKYSF